MTTVQRGAREMIVALTVAGRPQNEVARAAGISVRTLRRRLQEPDIVEAMAAATRDREQQALGRLADLRGLAFDALHDHLRSPDPAVQARAAKLVLEQGLAHRNAFTADRFAALELSLARIEASDATWFGAGS